MIPLLLLCFCSLADPKDSAWNILVSHWLEVKSVESKEFDPNVQEKHIFTVWPCYDTTKDDYLVIRTKDPNTYLEVTKFHRNRMNYVDFAIFARQYAGDPNWIPPVIPDIGKIEPNEPPDPCEPNLAEMLEGVTDKGLITAIKELMK